MEVFVIVTGAVFSVAEATRNQKDTKQTDCNMVKNNDQLQNKCMRANWKALKDTIRRG